jgi:hypothetical protein
LLLIIFFTLASLASDKMPRPTVSHLNLSVPQDIAGTVSVQQTQRTGRGTSRLGALVLSARGMLSTLSTARKKHVKGHSLTPDHSHLEPPVSAEQSYMWKLLPSQRQQLSELYHRHHELTDSFWGMYDLVHAASISVSPPALVEALVEVGVNVPQGSGVKSVEGAGLFLSEFQFLRVVEGIMTDSKYEHSYYENDKRLVELALDARDEGNGENSSREHELINIDNTKISVSRLSQILKQYDLGTKPLCTAAQNVGPSLTPPPAFLVAVLQDTAGSVKKSQRKSIVAPSRLDVPEHVSLDMLCSALNRATLTTPDPLSDFRSANVRADASPPGNRNSGASLGVPRVPARLSVTPMDNSTLEASFANSGPPPIADQSLEIVVPLAGGATETSRAVPPVASARTHSHGSSPRGAKRLRQHKMISSTGTSDIPLPPLKKGPGLWELAGQGANLRRHDSLDHLLRTTMDSCVEVTRALESNILKRQASETKVPQLKRHVVKRSGPLSPDNPLAENQSISDADEEFSECSSMGSIQRRHDAADQRFGAFHVFVSGTYTPPRVGASGNNFLPPLYPPKFDTSEISPVASCLRAAPSYRKPWQESIAEVDVEARRHKRKMERKAKESRKIGMEALVAEVHALSLSERRALTPNTRRMVAIARSASSLGDHRAALPRVSSPAKNSEVVEVPHRLLDRWTRGGM